MQMFRASVFCYVLVNSLAALAFGSAGVDIGQDAGHSNIKFLVARDHHSISRASYEPRRKYGTTSGISGDTIYRFDDYLSAPQGFVFLTINYIVNGAAKTWTGLAKKTPDFTLLFDSRTEILSIDRVTWDESQSWKYGPLKFGSNFDGIKSYRTEYQEYLRITGMVARVERSVFDSKTGKVVQLRERRGFAF